LRLAWGPPAPTRSALRPHRCWSWAGFSFASGLQWSVRSNRRLQLQPVPVCLPALGRAFLFGVVAGLDYDHFGSLHLLTRLGDTSGRCRSPRVLCFLRSPGVTTICLEVL